MLIFNARSYRRNTRSDDTENMQNIPKIQWPYKLRLPGRHVPAGRKCSNHELLKNDHLLDLRICADLKMVKIEPAVQCACVQHNSVISCCECLIYECGDISRHHIKATHTCGAKDC